jgi:hypothetical protein
MTYIDQYTLTLVTTYNFPKIVGIRFIIKISASNVSPWFLASMEVNVVKGMLKKGRVRTPLLG